MYDVERRMISLFESGRKINLKVVVEPFNEENSYRKEIKYGLHEDINIKVVEDRGAWGRTYNVLEFRINGYEHNFGVINHKTSFVSYSKSLSKLWAQVNGIKQKCTVYCKVDGITKKELIEILNK